MSEQRSGGHKFWRRVWDVDRFFRLHMLGFTCMWPLLGAASVQKSLSLEQVVVLLGVGTCLHVYGTLLNDLVDLPVDRSQPQRARDPLVRGAVRPWQAATIALAQLPAGAVLTLWLGGGREAFLAFAATFGLMTLYDLFGKRCPVPPVTDAVQGLSLGALTLWGVTLVGQPVNALSLSVAAYSVVFVQLVNGLHFGLRDFDNDYRCGMRTTAMFFGARPDGEGRIRVPPLVWAWGYLLQLALIATILTPLLRNDFGFTPAGRGGVLAVFLVIAGACLWWLADIFRPGRGNWDRALCLQLLAVLLVVALPFLAYLTPPVRTVLLVLFFGPFVFIERARTLAAQIWGRVFATPEGGRHVRQDRAAP